MISDQYQQFLGRAPTSAETLTWSSSLTQGRSDIRSLDLCLLAQPGAVETFVTGMYQTYLGTPPTNSDLAFWDPRLSTGLVSADQFKVALLNDPIGRAHVVAEITSLYETYFERAPDSAEVAVWSGVLSEGGNFNELENALIADPGGQAHNFSVVTDLYRSFFGRDPVAAELNVWEVDLRSGGSYDHIGSVLSDYVQQHHLQTAGTPNPSYGVHHWEY